MFSIMYLIKFVRHVLSRNRNISLGRNVKTEIICFSIYKWRILPIFPLKLLIKFPS